jgi:Ca-activated chloride channel homolog
MWRILVMAVWAAGWPILLVGCGSDVGGLPERSHSGSRSAAAPAASPADTPADVPFTAPAPAARYIPQDLSRPLMPAPTGVPAGDRFEPFSEDAFHVAFDEPLSTFAIDVDTASYTKTRAYLMQHNTMPQADAVRIEELINYFQYDYAPPDGEHPFAVHAETAQCPWNGQNRLVRVGLKGKELHGDRPSSNLVFLIDVSGSMNAHNKLPLVKRGLRMLVDRLNENDRVAIVVYASATGLVLPSTSGDQKHVIHSAIERLQAGGSTNGGQGIQVAYGTAREHYLQGGVNRVILCSDGDFNVGVTSTAQLVQLAAENARSGVFLSVLGFGVGNHNDAMMEQLSNKADGNYAFIDNEAEAYRVLVEQLSGTLVTIAKDVKIQVEFNPARVAAYRLIGYENRRLAARDFNDDSKDAGEIGAGHTVTALYEVTPAGVLGGLATSEVDPLKYQPERSVTAVSDNGELLTVKLRYKSPEASESTRLELAVRDSGAGFSDASADLRFASAVAAFGMLLRGSRFAGDVDYAAVHEIARTSLGSDRNGYRSEFLELVERAAQLSGQELPPFSALSASYMNLPPISRYHYSRPRITPHGIFSWYLVWCTVSVVGAAMALFAVALATALRGPRPAGLVAAAPVPAAKPKAFCRVTRDQYRGLTL